MKTNLRSIYQLSNGGYVAAQLAAQTDSRIAAAAVLSGRSGFPTEMPPPGDPVSVLFVCGKVDEVANYNGGNFGAGFNFP